MKYITPFLLSALFAAAFLPATSCSQTSVAGNSANSIVLVGSTPADESVKAMLGIAPEAKVETIRWEMSLATGQKNSNPFSLNVIYGETKPNTRDLIVDNKLSLAGNYTVIRSSENNAPREIYQLKMDKTSLALVKVTDDIFHLLSQDNKLMVGNGGWSYTLNRKQPSAPSASLPVLTKVADDRSTQVIFTGRTPCTEIATQFKIEIPEGCFKLKWKLTLNRDPKTLAPTTYSLQRTHHRPTALEGKWIAKEKADAVIYQLDPDKPDQSMSFLRGDENVMFFLDKNERLFIGNGEFSYTMDKKIQ